MDNLNKIISFILGLVVVIVFFAVITGRINLKNRLPIFSAKVSPTPTQELSGSTSTSQSTDEKSEKNTVYNTYQTNQPISKIPATGSPTFMLPLLFSGIGSGIFLKKLGRK